MSEWRQIALESALDRLIDYRGKSPPKSRTGIPVISAKVVKEGRITGPIEQTIDPDYYPIWMTRGVPNAGDIVMTTEGPLGEIAQLDRISAQYALGQRIVCLSGKKGVLDNTFLKFLLMSPVQQRILASYATGTTVAGISQKSLRSIPISLPPYEDQVSIGQILGALDDKIDLNRRMNQTLEAMARAMFKDWFVDFGPTRAKMEGSAPYLVPEIWSLFPDLLDNEGKPQGWEQVAAREMVEFNPPERLPRGQPAPYLDMAALATSGSWAETPTTRDFASGSKFRNGDVLLARITPCLENGKTAFVQNLAERAVGWGSTEFIVMRAHPPMPRAYSYILARDSAFRERAIRSMTGTSGRQRVQVDSLAGFELINPTDQVARVFDELISPSFEKIAANATEIQTLASTRDLLLPKLMSGEIRVRDAEKIVEAAQ
jgi:type I restriction enzyme S subunit